MSLNTRTSLASVGVERAWPRAQSPRPKSQAFIKQGHGSAEPGSRKRENL